MGVSVPAEALFGAVPLGLLTAADLPTAIERMFASDPDHFLTPITTAEAACFCGFPSAAALRQARHRGDHPETWDPDRNLYVGGRLACIRWLYRNAQIERTRT